MPNMIAWDLYRASSGSKWLKKVDSIFSMAPLPVSL
jgi:hypothetical protein